jgi:hypothetical protein
VKTVPYLRLDQHQIDEQHHEVVLDILVCEALAARTLRQSHALPKCSIISLAVGMVEGVDGKSAFDTYRHWSHCACVKKEEAA